MKITKISFVVIFIYYMTFFFTAYSFVSYCEDLDVFRYNHILGKIMYYVGVTVVTSIISTQYLVNFYKLIKNEQV